MPVSYTHLDVYKRQGGGVLDALKVLGCAGDAAGDVQIAGKLLPRHTPVSYTHLTRIAAIAAVCCSLFRAELSHQSVHPRFAGLVLSLIHI